MSAELCAACGLCCDGTLYGRVTVDDAEAARLQHLRLPLAPHGGGRVLPQPCAAYGSGGCAIYPERPGDCARYECLVYRQVRRGEMNLAAGLALVTRTRRLADEVRALLPGQDGRALIDALGSVLSGATDSSHARRAHAALLLAAASLAAACRTLDPRFGGQRGSNSSEEPT